MRKIDWWHRRWPPMTLKGQKCQTGSGLTFQGHRKSTNLVPFEGPYTTFYWWIIVTLSLFRTVYEIWAVKVQKFILPLGELGGLIFSKKVASVAGDVIILSPEFQKSISDIADDLRWPWKVNNAKPEVVYLGLTSQGHRKSTNLVPFERPYTTFY